MKSAPTAPCPACGAATLCPVCGHTDPDCLACGGAGVVGAGLGACPGCEAEVDRAPSCRLCEGRGLVRRGEVEECPADHAGAPLGRRCRHCGGTGYVRAEDLPYVLDALADEAEAEAERMAQRGLHVSGVPFEGPF